jgi:tRNA threonylcarbamoyladenosine biosynthesis protein TsaE
MPDTTDERFGHAEMLSLTDTEAFGRRLGSHLFPGAVVSLIGQLGAGKTHLTRAIAEGLQIRNPMAVNSPTFVLIQEYAARLPIYHFDAYRLKNDREFLELGVEEYFDGEGVSIVEWADRVAGAMPRQRLEIRIEVLDETRRRFEWLAFGRRYAELAQKL